MKEKEFYIVPALLEEMLRDDGLEPPSRQTLKNWRSGRVAFNKTKSGVKEYEVKPKLVINIDFEEIPGKRKKIRYSQAGYNAVLALTNLINKKRKKGN